jgi:glycosyltransferase involved in cell wall biosynthesis
MQHPLVSVIVPTFNRAHSLVRCLDSILQQSVSDFELIVVDDGSDDATPQTLAAYDHRVNVLRQENKGVAAARNAGIAVARGQYLAFCDSDDLWHAEKLAKQLRLFAEIPAAMLCYTDEIWIRNGRRVNPCKRHGKMSGWAFAKCLDMCIVSPSSVMMPCTFFAQVGLFDEQMTVCEDYDLWLRSSLLFPFHFIPEPLIIKHGGHSDQLSHKYWGMDRYRVAAIVKCLETAQLGQEQRQLAIATLVQKCNILANGAEKRGRSEEAAAYHALMQRW